MALGIANDFWRFVLPESKPLSQIQGNADITSVLTMVEPTAENLGNVNQNHQARCKEKGKSPQKLIEFDEIALLCDDDYIGL